MSTEDRVNSLSNSEKMVGVSGHNNGRRTKGEVGIRDEERKMDQSRCCPRSDSTWTVRLRTKVGNVNEGGQPDLTERGTTDIPIEEIQ